MPSEPAIGRWLQDFLKCSSSGLPAFAEAMAGRQRMSRIGVVDAGDPDVSVGLLLVSAAADALQLSSDLQQRGRTLPDLSE